MEDFANQQYTVSPAGRELFGVIQAVERWLEKAPGKRLVLTEDKEAQLPVRAFLDGWSSGIQGALAPGPLTAKELGLALDTLSRRSLRGKLAKMRDTGLVEARPDDDDGTVYAVTDRLREAIGPFVLAVRCEVRQIDNQTGAIAPRDIDTAFLLALPLLELPRKLSGSCRLLVDLPESGGRRAAGAMVHVEGGRVASCTADLEGTADSWAMGPVLAWLDAAIDGNLDGIEFGGEEHLPRTLLEQLHEVLYGLPMTGER